MTAVDPVDRLRAVLDNVRPCGAGGFTARCPAHDDRHNSLKVDAGDAGTALVHCHAGCEPAAIVAALNLTLADLYPPDPTLVARNGHSRYIVATYDYPDADGTLLYQAVRFEPKGFSQRRPDGRGGWSWNLGSTQRVLYRLPDLLAADRAEPVCLCEGEKDADRLAALGFVATTNAAGADQWRPEYSDVLRGRCVVSVEDNDEAGRKRTARVGAALVGLATEVRTLALPNLPEKGDVSDWLDAGGDAGELRRLIAEAPMWQPTNTPNSPNGRTAPVFPIEALPPNIRAYVEAAAESIPVPVEMVAVPLLGGVGALLGNRLYLALKASYREYPSLYLALIAPPGAAKSPALKLGMWPLDVLQRQAMKNYRAELATFETDLERWKARKPEERGDKPVKPTLRHYFSSNLTLEALVGMLERAPGVAIIRDEILSWVRSMDQYRGGKGSDRQEFLSLWASATIKADRKGGEPIYRSCPVACVVGGIQPDFVAELHDEANRRDGFVERLLPVVLDLGTSRWTEATIDPERFADVLNVFEALDTLPSADHSDDQTQPAGIAVTLHPDAKKLWTAWFDDNAALVEAAPALAAGFYRKLPAHVARFALILHALWQPDDPRPMVSAERMADAIELGEFFREHVGRLLPLFGATGGDRSAGISTRILRILGLPEAQGDDGWVARSEIMNRLRYVTADDLSMALSSLLATGAVETGSKKTATKPFEGWRLALREDSEDSEYSRFPAVDVADSSPPADPFWSSEDSEYLLEPGENSEYSESSRRRDAPKPAAGQDDNADPTVATWAREIATFTDAELAQYRAEMDATRDDAPPSPEELAALALAEAMRRGKAG